MTFVILAFSLLTKKPKIRYVYTRRQTMETTKELAIDSQDPPTFEKVWKLFQETREQLREMSREAQEENRKLWEQIAATDKQMKETDKKFGEFTNRFGRMVEHMVLPNLLDRFKALGFAFEVGTQNYKIVDEKNNVFVEVDAFLENGDKVMIVEIKATPSVEDIADHVKRMEKLRKRADLRGDDRRYLGAIAGVAVSEAIKNKALKNGFFVLVPSGDTFAIIKPEGKYHVREW
jgi:TPP-dependent indolepyruvate ferredoxin oxidoreductase alpha subunit